ncbi:MAG TPA: hypothetical protein VGT05_04060 [Patescibacteria group bacterium]|nr:hypothetical protein [Patescibacteria group bacterium]
MPSVDNPDFLIIPKGAHPNVVDQVKANIAEIAISRGVTYSQDPYVRIPRYLPFLETGFRFSGDSMQFFGMGNGEYPVQGKKRIETEAERKARLEELPPEDTILFSLDTLASYVYQGMGIHSLKQFQSKQAHSYTSTGERGIPGMPHSNIEKKRQIVDNIVREAQLQKRIKDALLADKNNPLLSPFPQTPETAAGSPKKVSGVYVNLRRSHVTEMAETGTPELLELAVPFIIYDARQYTQGDKTLGITDEQKKIVHDDVVWLLRFLQTKYKSVRPVFIVHAKSVSQVASLDELLAYQQENVVYAPQYLGYKQALDIINRQEFDPEIADFLLFDFTTGYVQNVDDQAISLVKVGGLRNKCIRTAITIMREELELTPLEYGLIGHGNVLLPGVVVARIAKHIGVVPLLRMQLSEKDESHIQQNEVKIAE